MLSLFQRPQNEVAESANETRPDPVSFRPFQRYVGRDEVQKRAIERANGTVVPPAAAPIARRPPRGQYAAAMRQAQPPAPRMQPAVTPVQPPVPAPAPRVAPQPIPAPVPPAIARPAVMPQNPMAGYGGLANPMARPAVSPAAPTAGFGGLPAPGPAAQPMVSLDPYNPGW